MRRNTLAQPKMVIMALHHRRGPPYRGSEVDNIIMHMAMVVSHHLIPSRTILNSVTPAVILDMVLTLQVPPCRTTHTIGLHWPRNHNNNGFTRVVILNSITCWSHNGKEQLRGRDCRGKSIRRSYFVLEELCLCQIASTMPHLPILTHQIGRRLISLSLWQFLYQTLCIAFRISDWPCINHWWACMHFGCFTSSMDFILLIGASQFSTHFQ